MTGESKTSTENREQEAHDDKQEVLLVPEDEKWLIRDCETYYEEYKECTSLKGRFHQYFIFGESLDCNQWKKDYDNCSKWEDSKDCKAAISLINSEKERRLTRLRAHYRNNVWKKRAAPPEDWNKPLPQWMVQRDEKTYLAEKSMELREGKLKEDKSFCVIM